MVEDEERTLEVCLDITSMIAMIEEVMKRSYLKHTLLDNSDISSKGLDLFSEQGFLESLR